jgi:hypothetical protein
MNSKIRNKNSKSNEQKKLIELYVQLIHCVYKNIRVSNPTCTITFF